MIDEEFIGFDEIARHLFGDLETARQWEQTMDFKPQWRLMAGKEVICEGRKFVLMGDVLAKAADWTPEEIESMLPKEPT